MNRSGKGGGKRGGNFLRFSACGVYTSHLHPSLSVAAVSMTLQGKKVNIVAINF